MKLNTGDYVSVDLGDWEPEWHDAVVLNAESVGMDLATSGNRRSFCLGDNDDVPVDQRNDVNIYVAAIMTLDDAQVNTLLSYDGDQWTPTWLPNGPIGVEPIMSDKIAAVARFKETGIKLAM